MNQLRILSAAVLVSALVACDSKNPPPTTPTPTPTPSPTPPTLTKPVPDSPGDGAQLDNVRPTLTVVNGTSNQTAAKTYEFQVSDDAGFASLTANPGFAATVSSSPVAEDASGRTAFTVAQDLQPTTKYYWRARMVQSNTASEWSEVRTFKTKLVGYNRPGALYDPLVNSETLGTVVGNVTFVPGQGVRLNDEFSYVVYELPQTFSAGEMSAEVTGLAPAGRPGKARIISMLDRLGGIASSSRYSFNLQYRGVDGVPEDTITWKAVLGDNDHSVEPTVSRFNTIIRLDPSRVYLWQAFWTPTSFRVVVKDGGATGAVVYDQSNTAAPGTGSWNPARMYAFIGTNNGTFTANDGSRVGMTVKNLWVGSTPRPTTLGNALSDRPF